MLFSLDFCVAFPLKIHTIFKGSDKEFGGDFMPCLIFCLFCVGSLIIFIIELKASFMYWSPDNIYSRPSF